MCRTVSISVDIELLFIDHTISADLSADISAAFGTINRRHLLDIVKSIVDEDEHRLMQFLLSGTVIGTRINGTSTPKPFTSNVGTPQGDSLSPILFTV